MMEKRKHTSTRVDSSSCNGNLWMESGLHRRVSESDNSGITFSFISQVQSPRRDYGRTNGRACSCQVLLKLYIPAAPFSARHSLWEVLVFNLEVQRFHHLRDEDSELLTCLNSLRLRTFLPSNASPKGNWLFHFPWSWSFTNRTILLMSRSSHLQCKVYLSPW